MLSALKKATLRAFLASVLLLFAGPSRSAGDMASLDRPDWIIGESWTWRVTKYPALNSPNTVVETRTQTVSELHLGHYVTQRKRQVGDDVPTSGRTRWSRDLNLMTRRAGAVDWQEFKWYVWPLAEAAQWTMQYGAGSPEESTWKVAVKGWETITVPAGTFRTLRIEATWDGWASGYVMSAKYSNWYAPATKASVKWESYWYLRNFATSHEVGELVQYRKGGDAPVEPPGR